jgi:hypothetical protein
VISDFILLVNISLDIPRRKLADSILGPRSYATHLFSALAHIRSSSAGKLLLTHAPIVGFGTEQAMHEDNWSIARLGLILAFV